MLIYRSADGNIKIDVRMGEETVWLTQDLAACCLAHRCGVEVGTLEEHCSGGFGDT